MNNLPAPHQLTVLGGMQGAIQVGQCHCDTTGTLTVGGDLGYLNVLYSLGGDFTVEGDVLGAVVIGASVSAGGTLQIKGGVTPDPQDPNAVGVVIGDPAHTEYPADVSGTIAIGAISGDLQGALTVRGGVESTGTVTIGGGVTQAGYVFIGDDLLGTLDIDGPVASAATPRITIGNPNNPLAVGDVAGDLNVGGATGGLAGVLRIKGTIQPGADVHISGGVGDTGQVQSGTVLGTLQVDGAIGAGTDPNDPRVLINGAIGGQASDAQVLLNWGGLNGLLKVTGGIESGATLDINGGLANSGRVKVGSHVAGTLVTRGTIEPEPDPNDPRVRIGGSLTGSMQTIGELRGRVHIAGSVDRGTLQLNGDVLAGAQIVVAGDMNGEIGVAPQNERPGNMRGDLLIGGDLSGQIDIAGCLGDPKTPAVGHIRVNGGFAPAVPEGGEEDPPAPLIRIRQLCNPGLGQLIGTRSDITFDFDGWNDGDDWDQTAFVIIGPDPNAPDCVFNENTPKLHIYEITPCKGDMNNDGLTDFADINPFTLALSNPETYASTYPGLGGSRVYHGDINEDGLFNFGDINPFVALLSDPNNPCAAADEGAGEGDDEMMMMEAPEDGGEANATPEGMAAGLANVVPPQGYDDLLGLVGFAIENAPDEPQGAYWLAVYDALTE